MDRIDCWMSEKNKPQVKETSKGGVMEVRVTVQSFAYDHWLAAGRPEGQAPDRYVLATLSIWDEPLQQYVQKIYDKAMGTLESKDPRPHIHVIGKWKERVYNGLCSCPNGARVDDGIRSTPRDVCMVRVSSPRSL
ncbi:MAG: hypothetical protein EBT03_06930 [Betaproteobacteria bacterium]|nr:hypothetical protein [Betaproteobacteria bacterium]